MTIAETHRIFSLILKKTQNEYMPHEDIDDLLHVAQMDYFANLLGNYKQYQAGRSVPTVVYGQTQRTLDELNPFKEKITFMKAPYNATTMPYGVTDGVLVLPSDYEYLDSVYGIVLKNGDRRERGIKVVDGEEWARRLDSAMNPPSKMNTVAMLDGAGGTVNDIDIEDRKRLKFAPEDVSGYLYYFRTPARPEYVYTLVGRVETHDAASSTDLEWNTVSAHNIIIRALKLAGVITEDPVVLQTMSQVTEE